MKPRIYRLVPLPVFHNGNLRSIPAGIDSAAPLRPVPVVRALEYPQGISTTAGIMISPMEPGNESRLASQHPLESPSDLPAEAR